MGKRPRHRIFRLKDRYVYQHQLFRTFFNHIYLDPPRARAPPGPSVQPDWNDYVMDQEVIHDDRSPRLVSRMNAPQVPLVPMPLVDFPLNNQEEDSDDATVVGTDNEEEAAAQASLQERVPRQVIPVIKDVISYDASNPDIEIVTLE